MAEAKTKPTNVKVDDFIGELASAEQQEDCKTLCCMMTEMSGEPAVMWGAGIIGFGTYHYKYESGHEGDAAVIGFAPRKTNLTVYIGDGLDKYSEQLAKLGRHRRAKVCLHFKRLKDIDVEVLREIVGWSLKAMKERYGV